MVENVTFFLHFTFEYRLINKEAQWESDELVSTYICVLNV